MKTTLGINKMWTLYTGGLFMQVQQYRKYTPWGPVKCGLFKQVVFIYRWSFRAGLIVLKAK